MSAKNSSAIVASDRNWLWRSVWLIAALAVVRLVYAAIVPVDLVHDEAYYWDWSRQLDWGYYSKPPMVAWLIALSTSLGGASSLFVRMPAIVLGTAGLMWMYLLASHLYGRKAGFWAVCLAAATPANAALSLVMTIDAPLLFCWGAALYTFWRMWEPGPHQKWWLLGAIASVGLGLLSKQTMLGFLALGGCFLLVSREDRRELWRPRFWLWALGALLFLAPVVWWNSQHGWITAQHTSEHFQANGVNLWKHLARSAEFLATQFGVVSPVTYVLLLAALVAGFRGALRLGRRERYLLCFSGPPLAAVLVLSLVQRVEPNWPAVFYLSAVILLVGLAAGGVALPSWPRLNETALRRAVFVGAASVLFTYLLPFGWGLEGGKLDAVVRLRGWKQLGNRIGQRFESFPRPQQTLVVVAGGRAETSELAFYIPQQPHVYQYAPGFGIRSQYDLWGGPRGKSGWDALIVTPKESPAPPELAAAFERVEDHGAVSVHIGHGRCHDFHVWRGVRLRAWPGQRASVAHSGAAGLQR
jgi:undecaprenyl-diphosphatase